MSGKLLDAVSECTLMGIGHELMRPKGRKVGAEESELLTPESIQIAPTDHD